ncbi:S1 family peptidase [Chelatococcus sp. GCM10030263]|uniref:S1 family peptidase n=1 Tax=Chelatococcus sp. GCM10030263 TaxID=3273387 RepID=UPI003615610F
MQARLVRGRIAPALVAIALAGLPQAARAVVGGRQGGALEAVSLMVLGSRGSVCSGVVLAPDVVLTAAHCVTGADAFRVHFRDPSGQPVLLEPAGIAVHPGYRADAVKTRQRSIDLALVRVATPLPRRFAPAVLAPAEASPPAGTTLVLGGWGVTAEGDGRSSGTFRTASLVAVEPYGQSHILVWAADPRGLGKKPGAGACEGDSGGPIALSSGAVIAVSTWSKGQGRKACGLVSQGVLLGPQRAFIDGTLARWGRQAQWAGD